MGFSRYAVFYTLPDGPLSAFANAWLGWDLTAGRNVAHPQIKGLPAPIADLTKGPRKYGFHGTLKPPFALCKGQDEAALTAAVKRLSVQVVPVQLDGLNLAPMGRFLALLPEGDQTQLNGLAAMCVETLDAFRASPSRDECARHTQPGLRPRNLELLRRWGYPYVMDAFRFHMTLTDRLPKAQVEPVRDVLERAIFPLLPKPFIIDALSLVGEDAATGRFNLIRRFDLHM